MGLFRLGIVFSLVLVLSSVGIDADLTKVCENVPNNALIRHPWGCNYYFVCLNNLAYFNICTEPLLFDGIGNCTDPKSVDCSRCSPHGQYAIRVPGTCDSFINCDNGSPTVMHCSSGKYFDTNAQVCRHQNEVKCTPAPTTIG